MTASGIYVGIDVSKNTLDVYADGEAFRVSNDDEGIDALVARLREKEVRLVAFESSGHYHRRLQEALLAKKIPGHLANPSRVKAFGTAKGRHAKTDPLDAN